MTLDEILNAGDAWYSVFCSMYSSLNLDKEQKERLSNVFRNFIEEKMPNNNFNPEVRENLLSAYKKAYYITTGKNYIPSKENNIY